MYNFRACEDEDLQYFSNLWCERACTSGRSRRNAVAKNYLIYILGFSQKTFEDFENSSYPETVLLQSDAKKRKNDFEYFWQEVKKVYPSDYTEKDIIFLTLSGKAAVDLIIASFQSFNGTERLIKLIGLERNAKGNK